MSELSDKIKAENAFVKYLEEIGKDKIFGEYIYKQGMTTSAKFLNETNPEDFILNAFHWSITFEGYEEWDEINSEWFRRLSKIKPLEA